MFGATRRNHGLLGFDAPGVQEDLAGPKVGDRFSLRIPRERWALP